MGEGLYLYYELERVNKRWFRFRSSRLIHTFQFQLRWTEQGLWGKGEHLCSRAEKEGQKKWLILKEQRALFTQLQAPLLLATPSLSLADSLSLALFYILPPSSPRLRQSV